MSTGSTVEGLHELGILRFFPETNDESAEDLRGRIGDARTKVNIFGLTRNFYATPEFLELLGDLASRLPVTMYAMDPFCDSRRDRFRLEPATARWGDPDRYTRLVLTPLSQVPGLSLFTFNFPCSFAIEEIDEVCRVMLYGHGRRGTDSPIWVYGAGNPVHEYFVGQIRWLESLVDSPSEYWSSKGILVRRYPG